MSLTPPITYYRDEVYLRSLKLFERIWDTGQVLPVPEALTVVSSQDDAEQRRVLTDEKRLEKKGRSVSLQINTILPGRHGTTGESYTRLPNSKETGDGQLRRVAVASEDQL
jgi:hypothetical protein